LLDVPQELVPAGLLQVATQSLDPVCSTLREARHLLALTLLPHLPAALAKHLRHLARLTASLVRTLV
jgi:hypothetical protein